MCNYEKFDLWFFIKNMVFIFKFYCGIGIFILFKIRNMRKNLGRKIKNKLDFVRSIIWIIFFFFGRKDCFCFFVFC